MPTGLQEIETSFKQVQKDYQSYAKRRQVLAIEVRIVIYLLPCFV